MTSADLTVDDLRLAYELVTRPVWLQRIQEAEGVVVRGTPHVDDQTIYLVDLRESAIPEDRVLIVCVPDHVTAVRAAVQGLRGQR